MLLEMACDSTPSSSTAVPTKVAAGAKGENGPPRHVNDNTLNNGANMAPKQFADGGAVTGSGGAQQGGTPPEAAVGGDGAPHAQLSVAEFAEMMNLSHSEAAELLAMEIGDLGDMELDLEGCPCCQPGGGFGVFNI
jgi:hypothetical protein